MLACHNILSPATGKPIVAPSQDMVLGCYYLTAENPNATKGEGRRFGSMEDAIRAFEQGLVDLHARVWLRYEGEVETSEPDNDIKEEEQLSDGSKIKYYRERFVRESSAGEQLTQYVNTTVGRIIYNHTIQAAIN